MSRRSISVVVPTVGRRHLLPETLDSVIDQTRPPDEVIVVLDGDRDGTGAMLTSRFPRVVQVQGRGEGDGAARRRGVRTAKGEWVAFLDDDDLWHPDFLAEVEAHLEAHPGCKAVRAPFYVFASDATAPERIFGLRRDVVAPDREALVAHAAAHAPTNDFGYLDIEGNSLAAMLERNRGAILTSVVSAEVLRKVPPLPIGLRTGADWVLLTDVSALTEWCLLSRPLAFYRVHAGQFTSRPFIPLATAHTTRMLWQRYGSRVPDQQALRDVYVERFRDLAWGAVRAGRPGDVPAILNDAWAALPDLAARVRVLVPHPLAVRWQARHHD